MHTESSADWRAIERLLDEIGDLSQADIAPEAFFRGTLERTLRALGLERGAIWSGPATGSWSLTHVVGTFAPESLHRLHDRPQRGPALMQLAEPTRDAQSAEELWLYPLRLDGQTLAVLGLVRDAREDLAVTQATNRLLAAVEEMAADFQRNRERRKLRQLGELWLELAEFERRIHRTLELAPTAFEVVHEARRLIRCDRVSVAARRGRRTWLLAVSGTAEWDRRSDTVQRLQTLVGAVLQSRTPLLHGLTTSPLTAAELPPEIERPLQGYVDRSAARVVVVVPLPSPVADARPTAELALIVEQFAGEIGPEFEARINAVCDRAATALHNAWEYDTLPGLGLMRRVRRLTGFVRGPSGTRTVVGLLTILLFALALLLVPARFTIEAEGELQPVNVRDVFAPSDGEVQDVLVQHQQAVEAGAVLAVLRSTPLDLEFRRVLGERDTTRERLSATESARLTDRPGTSDRSVAPSALSGTEEELRKLLEGYEAQLAILREQRTALTLRSPLRGTVLTWDVRQLLAARPVQRGQSLLRVGATDGPWQVRVAVPERRAGHVQTGMRSVARGEGLRVTFVLATEPGTTYEARLTDVANVTEPVAGARPIVRGTASLTDDTAARCPLRAGAAVRVRIDCGRRPLGYVWFRELGEFGLEMLW